MTEGRWPPLEKRVLDAVRHAGGLSLHDIEETLDVISGNEWIVAEALDDLMARGAIERRESDGRQATFALT